MVFAAVVSERPPLLFEVRCHGHDLTLGGLPWHYIITPYNLRGSFNVCALSNHQLV
jgi:DDB1- and CUL4-associated factor 17